MHCPVHASSPTAWTGQPNRKGGGIVFSARPKTDWRNSAACRDHDPELFWPIGTTGPALVQIADAKAVCARCPVTSACLTWALAYGEDHGIWAGLTADERRALRTSREVAA